jgi:hypothetical protein
VAEPPQDEGAPVLTLDGTAVFGGIEVGGSPRFGSRLPADRAPAGTDNPAL